MDRINKVLSDEERANNVKEALKFLSEEERLENYKALDKALAESGFDVMFSLTNKRKSNKWPRVDAPTVYVLSVSFAILSLMLLLLLGGK